MDWMTDSHETLSTRLNVPDHCRRDPGISKLPGVDALNVAVHRTSVHKRVMVYHRNAIVDVLVDVGHIGDLIDRVVVVHVGDLNHTDAGVGHVYVLNIARTGAIPRDINLLRAEWKPSYWL